MTDEEQQEKKQTFEETMADLEKIVEKLEAGELSLDESLEYYQRGVKAVKHCRGILDGHEKKLKMLLEDEEGEQIEEDFG